MNQSEVITTPLGMGAGIIREHSYAPTDKIPSLIILQPLYQNEATGHIMPARSMELGDIATEQLYKFLKSYYESEEPEEKKLQYYKATKSSNDLTLIGYYTGKEMERIANFHQGCHFWEVTEEEFKLGAESP